jgi:phosphoadenosine phosphosulfate reductase
MINGQATMKVENTAWLENANARERVRWAAEAYGGRLVMSTSFGIQSAVMLHLVTREIPDIPVIFIDTGYLFPETYRFAEELTGRLELNLKVYTPLWTAARQEAIYGKRWEQDVAGLEAYNRDNKVEPMNRALKELGAEAWLSGLRRVQASTRSKLEVVQQQKRTVKIHPIIDWSEKVVYEYLKAHDLPFHPFWEQGYVSVGDWHSSAPLGSNMTAEETRFGGLKRECGLHETSDQADWQI